MSAPTGHHPAPASSALAGQLAIRGRSRHRGTPTRAPRPPNLLGIPPTERPWLRLKSGQGKDPDRCLGSRGGRFPRQGVDSYGANIVPQAVKSVTYGIILN